jgi:hypothetical protein
MYPSATECCSVGFCSPTLLPNHPPPHYRTNLELSSLPLEQLLPLLEKIASIRYNSRETLPIQEGQLPQHTPFFVLVESFLFALYILLDNTL